jgi:predicted dehydrogenase
MGQIFKNSKKQINIKRILIVGTGAIALRHYENIVKLNKNYEIDFFTRKKKLKTKKYQINSNLINNFKKAISTKYFAVIICNPSSHHLKFALPFAKNGSNLYIEKPISSDNINETIRLYKISKVNKITLHVGYNLLFLNSLNYLNKSIKEKKLGKIKIVKVDTGYYLPFWRQKDYKGTVSARKELGGGVLLELSHELNFLIHFFDLPKSIQANTGKISKLKLNVEDYANIFLKFKNKIICNCNLDFINKNYTRKLEIISDKGTFFWDFKKNIVKKTIFDDDTKKKNLKTMKFLKQDTYYLSMKYFLSLCKKKKPNSYLIKAINTLRLAIYAKKSAKMNKSIILRKKDFNIN